MASGSLTRILTGRRMAWHGARLPTMPYCGPQIGSNILSMNPFDLETWVERKQTQHCGLALAERQQPPRHGSAGLQAGSHD